MLALPAAGTRLDGLACSETPQAGDFHDTIMLPQTKGTKDDPATVGLRIQPGQFAGYSVRGRCTVCCACRLQAQGLGGEGGLRWASTGRVRG